MAGQYIYPLDREFLNLSGGTVSGDTLFEYNLTASTYYSGATPLELIIQNFITESDTFVQNGINTFTGGTPFRPTVNITAATLNSLSVSGNSIFNTVTATTLSGGTIFSGSTDLSLLFAPAGTVGDVTRVQNGLNTYTGGTGNNPTVNISALTIDHITVSGATNLNTLSANTISGGTYFSGSTPLQTVIQNIVNASDTFVQNGINTFTGGTAYRPTVNITAATLNSITVSGQSTFNTVTATTISGGTYFSGSTPLQTVIQNLITSTDTFVQNGINTFTGGTPYRPTVNITAATLNTLSVSGSTSLNSVSANTIYSGSTDLSLLFAPAGTVGDVTRVQNGLNTYTGGTGNNPTVNISALTIDHLTVSGSTNLNTISANTISGGTYFSGSTPLQTIIQNIVSGSDTFVQNGINTFTGGTAFRPTVNITAATLSTLSVSGQSIFNSVTATTLSGGTLYSGSTDLSLLFAPAGVANDITRVQNGLNTYTGGTGNFPTVNISALTIDHITVSGTSQFNTLSANTLYSGSTDLSLLFAPAGTSGDITRVQNGINTFTGGTGNLPTVNITALTINNLTVSGTTNINTVSANTISGGTYFSGSTPLENIIQSYITGQDTFVQNGINTFTGGTNYRPTVNVTALTINNINVSGASVFNTLTANTISGGTLFSGSTNLSNLFMPKPLSGGTDNRVVRWDGTDNIQSSLLSLTDSGNLLPVLNNAQDLGGNGSGFSNVYIYSSITYNTGLLIKNGSVSAVTLDNFGNVLTTGLLIRNTGELQTVGVGNGSVLPGYRGIGAIDLQTIRFNSGQVSSGNYSVIGGGIANKSTGLASSVGGGYENYAGNFGATVAGGAYNTASGVQSFVGGGRYNRATNTNSSVVGGYKNYSSGAESFIGSGYRNRSYGTYSSVVGGLRNIASGFSQTVIGKFNTVQGTPYSYLGTDNAFIIGNGTSTSNRSNAFAVTWQGAIQTKPFTGSTLPSVNVGDGALAYSAGTGFYQNINGVWTKIATTSFTGNTVTNVGGTQGLFKQQVGDQFQFKSLSAGTNISLSASTNEVAIYLKDNISVNSITATTISGGTYFSGSTPLQTVIQSLITSTDTFVQNGINTFTGGTAFRPTVNVTALTVNNISVSGSSNFNTLSANTISGGTLFSGSTPLETVIQNYITGSDTFVQDGINTFTGGTAFRPTVNVTAATLNNLTVSGNTSLNSVSANTIYSGSTDLSLLFQTIVNDNNDITRVQNGLNTYTGGTGNLPTVNISALTIDHLTVSASSVFNTVTATTISGGTYFSGSTPLQTIIQNIVSGSDTFVQNGINTFTGGTAFRPTVNITAATLNTLTVSGSTSLSSVSATTIYSGSTDLSLLFQTIANDNNDITRVQNGLNTYTGGTGNLPTVNISALTINNITVSGSSSFNTLTANTISGGTFFSGSTPLENIIQNYITGSDTFVQNGINTFTGGTPFRPTVNITAATLNSLSVSGNSLFNTLSANILSGGTIYSGSTDLSTYFGQLQYNIDQKYDKSGGTISGDVVVMGDVLINGNTTITGTATTINTETIQAKDNNILLNFSGNHLTAIGGGLYLVSGQTSGAASEIKTDSNGYWQIIPGLYASVISGDTYFSGSTPLESVIQNIVSGSDTFVQNGLNTYTGGTPYRPTVNVSALTVDHVTVSGASVLNTVTANTISGGTIYSGSTDLSLLFQTIVNDNNDITRVQNGLNTYTGGTGNNPTVNISGLTIDNINVSGSSIFNTLTANTISGGTYFSGSTPLENIIQSYITGSDTFVQDGVNTFTGGTIYRPTVNITAATLNNLVVSGTTSLNSVSATTIYSGSTDLSLLFQTIVNDNNDITRVQNGLNTYTGGTGNLPTVNISALTIDHITVSGDSVFNTITATTISGGTFFSGSTPLENIIQNYITGSDTFVQDGINTFTGGTNFRPTVNVTALTINSLVVSGTSILNSLTATTISGGTIYSGSTDLSLIFQTIANDNNDITRVQNGLNTYTGGTSNLPTVNISALTINNISVSGSSTFNTLTANTISGETFYSGSTPLESIIQNYITGSDTFVQDGLNTYTGGTAFRPTVNVSALTIDNISVSGSSIFNTVTANTFSAGTIYSGNTDLSLIFQTIGSDNDTFVQNGINTFTGGTPFRPTVNVTAATLSGLVVSGNTSLNSVSANTIYSGSTDLSLLFQTIVNDNNDITRVQNGLNTYTGGTGNNPTVNISALTIDHITVSGSSTFNTVTATTISGGTYFSGSTPLETIIQNYITGSDTFVQNGINTFTGGTPFRPTVNITAATLNNLTVSGTTSLNSVSATTIYSGSTDLSLLFQTIANDNNDITRVQNGLNTYTGGTDNLPTVNISALTVDHIVVSGTSQLNIVSGNTYYSGSTPLETVIQNYITGSDTFVQNGINTFTGGTAFRPTVNITAATLNTLTVSGNTTLSSLTATTISGGTIYSGSTDLSLIFQTIANDNNDITRVQNGLNTYTGGTGNLPTVNISALTINNISVSGASVFNTVTANTISGGTYFSGSTPLQTIIQNIVSGSDTFVQNGINTFTGGTAFRPTVNITAATLNNLTVSGTTSLGVVSATTIYSGSTDLSLLFQTIANDNNDITRVQNGLNTYTGGTGNLPTVNISALTINSISVSGLSTFNTVTATTISGETYFSGSTPLQTVVQNLISASDTFVQNGINTFTGGTAYRPTVNITAATLNSLIVSGTTSLGTTSATTIFSGSTDLSLLFAPIGTSGDITRVQNGLNTYTGGTGNLPTVNISALTINSISVSGNSTFNTITATTISGGTYFSGSTPLQTIIQNIVSGSDTFVQNGLNTYTGGTAYRPTVNVSALTVNNINVSGSSVFNTVTATTISGGTIYSGSTDLSLLFAPAGTSGDITRVQNGINTFTGGTGNLPTVNITALTVNSITVSGSSTFNTVTATTISGGTYFSGSTPLQTIIQNIVSGSDTFVQNGINTFTGGTQYRPTVNITAATLNSLTVSGTTSLGVTSATTLYSGSTDLSLLFAPAGTSGDITRVQNGLNTYTGGTGNLPTVNISALTINNISVSGSSTFNTVTATTISGGTFFSGSTSLETIIQNLTSGNNTFVQNGTNTFTGGTSFRPTVNITAATLNSLTVTGSTTLNTLTATTVSGGTIYSGSTNLESIFHQKAGYLLQKAGIVSGSTFAGSPKIATVTFTTNFADNNYAVTVTGEVNRTWTVESKTLSGFTINANANAGFTTNVFWIACQTGEGFK
jgi:hypothetical protein